MAYCVAADVPKRLPSLKPSLLGASAADTTAIIEEGIEWADSRIDAKLALRYTVPFEDPCPKMVKHISADLAAYFTARSSLSGGGEEAIDPLAVEIYKVACELLNQLAEGKVVLPDVGADDDPDGEATLAYYTHYGARPSLRRLPEPGIYYGADSDRCGSATFRFPDDPFGSWDR